MYYIIFAKKALRIIKLGSSNSSRAWLIYGVFLSGFRRISRLLSLGCVSHRRRRQVYRWSKAFQLGTAAVCYREKDCEIDVLYIYVYVYYTYTYARHVSHWIDSNVGSIGSRWFRYWHIPAYQTILYSPTRFFFFPSSLSAGSIDDCNILSLNSRVPGGARTVSRWESNFLCICDASCRALKLFHIGVTSISHFSRLDYYFLTSSVVHRMSNVIDIRVLNPL